MNTKALPPMTHVALQLLVNPPKMSTNSVIFVGDVLRSLERAYKPYSAEAPAGLPSP